MDKQIVHPWKEILFSKKREQPTDTHTTMDKFQKSYAKLNKPTPKGYTLNDSIYNTPWNMQNNKDRNQIRDQETGVKEPEGTSWHDGNVLHLYCNGCMTVYLC